MEDEDRTTNPVADWFARGMLTKEHVLSHINHAIEINNAIDPDEGTTIEATFSSASSSGPSGEGHALTETAFISLLQTKGTLPRGLGATEAGRVIYESIVYLSALPYIPHGPQPSGTLSLAQLNRALVWMLPDRTKRIIEESNLSRIRTRWDRLRLLFQSLAIGTVPLAAQDRVRDRARSLAARHAFDVSWDGYLDICVANHDDDGDEIYHDLLDVLYSTQEERPKWITPVARDAFRDIAKKIRAEEQLPELCTLAIPVQRFKDLVKVLLVLHMEIENTNDNENVDLSQYNDAADSLCAAFAQDRDIGTTDLITWPSFAQALETVAPYIVEPLYRLLTVTFMDEEAPLNISGPSDPPRNLPRDAILTLPRVSQLISFLDGNIETGYLRRTDRYVSPNFPTPAGLVRAMESVPEPEEAIVLFSGRVTAATGVAGKQEKPCVFGLFSPVPKKDGRCIQDPSETQPGNPRLRPCQLFQLSPVQDVFRGVAGEPGWGVVADAEGGEGVVFGGVSAIGSAGGRKGGVSLVLRDGLRRGRIQQWEGAVNAKLSGGVDGKKNKGMSYQANPSRGDWTLEFVVDEIEIWTEDSA
ncbi:hypothetical protein F5B19DRAFT_504532 [Rostrohypoxylon terebratum]|nr:hypothetical protein F5B19DRAFT_504532 [Rostrohypoxylon terebratum]